MRRTASARTRCVTSGPDPLTQQQAVPQPNVSIRTDQEYEMTKFSKRVAAIAGGVVLAGAMAFSAPAMAAGNAPTLVAQANGGFVLGQVKLEVSCTAKANQSLVKVTIIEECFTTNGLRAPGDTEVGPVANSVTQGNVDPGSLGSMQICARAISFDQFGIPSDE